MGGRSRGLPLVESRGPVDTHGLAGVSLAIFERSSRVITWHIPTATHNVVNVLTQLGTLGTFFASPDTEFGRGHKVRPLVQLLQVATVECAREDEATDGITISSGTVRIKLST